jgi:hypothetical protein
MGELPNKLTNLTITYITERNLIKVTKIAVYAGK